MSNADRRNTEQPASNVNSVQHSEGERNGLANLDCPAVVATDRAHRLVSEAIAVLVSSFDGPGLVDANGRLAAPEQQVNALTTAISKLYDARIAAANVATLHRHVAARSTGGAQ